MKKIKKQERNFSFNLFILVCFLFGIGATAYASDFVFTRSGASLEARAGNYRWLFRVGSPYSAKGAVQAIFPTQYCQGLDVFCGNFQVVEGDVAIELSSYAGRDVRKFFNKLSPAARSVIQQYGCAANYLNQHFSKIMLVTDNNQIDSILRKARRGDVFIFQGRLLQIVSATNDGKKLPHCPWLDGTKLIYVTDLQKW